MPSGRRSWTISIVACESSVSAVREPRSRAARLSAGPK